MSFRSVILATATLCAYVGDAHMIMQYPEPFSVDKVDSGPINQQQWPCKFNLGYTVSKMNAMVVGEKQTLSFKGSAVHGGGSCQLSVTTDTEPTANSTFKVIQTIEGGCPGVEKAESFPFTLPDSVPNGKATFAWTWFAKLSGGPEMYMNCAPIEVTGGASDTTAFDALPDMFVANLPGVTECKSPTSEAVRIPNPGQDVAKGDNGSDLADPTGCGTSGPEPSGGAGTPASSAAGGQPSAAPTSGNNGQYTPPGSGATSAAATSAATSAAAPTSAAGGASSAASAAPSATSNAAVTSAATSQPAATSAAASSGAAPGVSSAALIASTQTTLVTVTATPAVPVNSTPAASMPAATVPVGTAPAGTGSYGATPTSAPGAGGAGTCTTDGAIVCNGPTQFGICNRGSVVWQAVAAGTTCSNGSIQKRGYNGRVVRRSRGFAGHVHSY